MDVKIIACQMTLDLFEPRQEGHDRRTEIGGAAHLMEEAAKSDINLYI
ncbi:MAG: DsrE/DsrF/DrsH-like family protein [Paracoccaceae bacterium]